MRLSDFKVLTFDCYGTLIDWETGMLAALTPLTAAARAKTGRELSRDAVLEAHARHEAAAQKQTPTKLYRDLLAVVYRRLAEEWRVPARWEDCEIYGRSVGQWPAFADSQPALAYLKQHFQLVILSNVDNQSFALSNAHLGVAFDAIYTAEDIGSYKPDARNFNVHARQPGAARIRQDGYPAYRREPVPRSRSGQCGGSDFVLDLSPAWPERIRCDPRPGDTPAN